MTDEEPLRTEYASVPKSSPLPPPDGAGDFPSWVKNEKAKLEEKYWGDEGTLRGAKLRNDILWLRCYGWAVVVMMIFFIVVFMASLGAWVIHYITSWC